MTRGRSLTRAGAVASAAVLAAGLALAGCGASEAELLASSSAAAAASSAAVSSASAAAAAAASSAAAVASSSAAVARSAAEASRSSAAQAAASAAASSREADASRAASASAAARAASSAAAQSAKDAAAAAAAAGSDPADPDLPGDDGGPRCEGNEQYADEKPTGMRADAAAAWLAADAAAAAADIELCLADGKRSRAQQQETYDEYVTQYGEAMAAQYVLPPAKSAHVLGLAIDVQPYAAYTWLEGTKGSLGWCRIYDNEAWHFEYNADFMTQGCPARLPHPTP